MIEIRNRWDSSKVIFRSEVATDVRGAIAEAIEKARAERGPFAGADLAGANLAGANLADARRVTEGTEAVDPPEPYVRLAGPENLAKRIARFRAKHPEVPVIENLDQQILDRVESGAGRLDMSDWHTCATTHCRAGWAVALAGKAGYELEAKVGPQHAGAIIYRASTGRVPHFFASNERALEDIRRFAAEAQSVAEAAVE